ncbi:MarR family winged helix-turn-helix transcriptional regulator [Ascidiaceihabitans sp.]|uniref:MarR family winged helix-turn-helix transcriptional regulator n=1 Tax=Ascidiaceihabitans sp. TaxID=1872644 RepID=UPI003299152F
MSENSDDLGFDLVDFMPYLLNQAAEATSIEFQHFYKARYGMLRTEWRIVFHLGRYGAMTAKEICNRTNMHKTKISRGVGALESKRYLKREIDTSDRRLEKLSLTPQGARVFGELNKAAQDFNADFARLFSAEEGVILRRCLKRIAGL